MTAPLLFLTATDRDGLDAVRDGFQDGYYELEDIDFDAANGVLTVPFRLWSHDEARLVATRPSGRILRWLLDDDGADEASEKSWEAPWYRWFLRIRDVEAYNVEDDAEIGGADLHLISYDPAHSSIVLEGNFPVTITARVRSIAVEMEQTSEFLGLARYKTTGDSQSQTYAIFPHP